MDIGKLGLNLQDLIAGFGGGVAHTFAFRQTDPWTQVGSVLLGTLCANFLTPLVHDMYPSINTGGVAFLIGISAMAIAQGFVSVVQARLAKLAGGSSDGAKP